MKSKFTIAIKILSTIALTILGLSCLWLAYLVGYYIPLQYGWIGILLFVLVAGICGLGIAYMWLPEEEKQDYEWHYTRLAGTCGDEHEPHCPYCGRKIKVVE